VKGSLSIQRAGVNSSVGTFEQLSPTIVGYDNSLYIKSDVTFDEDELLSYQPFAPIPGKCKFVENIDDSECVFFNPVYNQKVSNSQAPYVASHPLVFDSRGYDNFTALGHIIFRCKSCGMAFSSSADTDLRVFVGPIDGYRRECELVPPAIFEPIEGILEARCRVPPGENETVPFQLRWGEVYGPIYYISYRAPEIEKILFGRNNSNATFQTLSYPLNEVDETLCLGTRVKDEECACRFTESSCGEYGTLTSYAEFDTIFHNPS